VKISALNQPENLIYVKKNNMEKEQDKVLEETLKNLKSTSAKTWIKTGLIVGAIFGAYIILNQYFGICIDC